MDQRIGDEEAFALGQRYALPFLGFGHFIVATAIKTEIDRLYFFTREGHFFRRIVDALGGAGLFAPDAIDTRLLSVSRLATFGPSLARLDTDGLMRIWRLYSAQTARALLLSLDVYDAEMRGHLERHGIDEDRLIREPWNDKALAAFLADPVVASGLAARLGANRDLLTSYLRQEGITETARIGIVDIGWRGTIQDNLALLLPQATILGCYFGLQPFLNPQPANTEKTAFAADLNDGDEIDEEILRFVAPMEMLANAPGGTVTGYRRDDGEIRPVVQENEAEDAVWHRFTRHFQDGVIDCADDFALRLRSDAGSAASLRTEARAVLIDLLTRPPAAIAARYFELQHNETFGTGEFHDKSRLAFPAFRRRWSWLRPKWRRQYSAFLASTGWPAGYESLVRDGRIS